MGIKIKGSTVISDSQVLELDGTNNFHKIQGSLKLSTDKTASITNGTGNLIIGGDGTGYALAFDKNKIQSRYNNTAISMGFNPEGGTVTFGGSVDVVGNITAATVKADSIEGQPDGTFGKVVTGTHVNTGEWVEIWGEIKMSKEGTPRAIVSSSTNYNAAGDFDYLTDGGGSSVAENGYLMFKEGVPPLPSFGGCLFWGQIGGGANSDNNWLTYPFNITKHQSQAVTDGVNLSIVLAADAGSGGTTVWNSGAVYASILIKYKPVEQFIPG